MTWRQCGAIEPEAQGTRCCGTQQRKPGRTVSRRSIPRNRGAVKTLTSRQTCVTRAANRGDQDPPRRLLRYDGKPAIGVGLSTVPGGNVVKLGAAVRKKLATLESNQPIGIEIGEINFQPEAVSTATNEFMKNLAKAVSIVVVPR